MPKLKYDWTKARELYDAGMSHPDIAKAIGCPVSVVRTRASRHKWNLVLKQRAMEKEAVREEVSNEWLRKEGNRWLRVANELLQRTTDAAVALKSPKTRSDLRQDVEILKGIIGAGREHYGLDGATNEVQVGFSLGNQAVRLAIVAQVQPSTEPRQAADESPAPDAQPVVEAQVIEPQQPDDSH